MSDAWAFCNDCGGKLGDTPYGTLACYGCQFRRERDEARAEVERLREINGELVDTHNQHVITISRLRDDLDRYSGKTAEQTTAPAQERRSVDTDPGATAPDRR